MLFQTIWVILKYNTNDLCTQLTLFNPMASIQMAVYFDASVQW